MQTITLEDRDHQRLRARIPVRFSACGGKPEPVVTQTLDVSSTGGAIEIPSAIATCTVGDRVRLELDLGDPATPFCTEGTVRSVVPLPRDDDTPRQLRIGVHFTEMLPLTRLPASAA